MNRKSIFIMLVIAFALIWQSNYGTTDIPENYVEASDNFHNFFDSLKDTMDQAGYTPADFLQAARAVLEGFKNGGYFTKFTQYTDQGFREAYEYVSDNPTFFGFEQGEFTSADATTFQKFFTFIQTCFTSFSTMTPIQQINAFIQISGLYICLEKLWVTTTGICTRIYNFGKLTITTFKTLYNILTNNDPTKDVNLPVIGIPPITVPTRGFSASATQVASPTMTQVKLALDSIIDKIQNPNNTTVEEGLVIYERSMSAAEAQKLVQNTENLDIPHFNVQRTVSVPTFLPSFNSQGFSEVDPGYNSDSNISYTNKFKTNPPNNIAFKKRSYSSTDVIPKGYTPKGFKKRSYSSTDVIPKGFKKGGKIRTIKRRKQSTKSRKTKRRKSTYKGRRLSSRKR